MTNYRYWLQITSSSWSFVYAILVLSWSSMIGSESFWPSILLLMEIIRVMVLVVIAVIEEEVGNELKWKVLSSIYSSSTLRGQGNLGIRVRTDGGLCREAICRVLRSRGGRIARRRLVYGVLSRGCLRAKGRWMILESVENDPLFWPTMEENGVTRLKKYSELSTTKAIQADCDVKATNIILQGLPPEVYALVSTHKVAKELWERIQMLMKGTSLTNQERECKLYDEFDKFAYRKEESLHDFYLRFSLLLNDMNFYNMKLEQFQVNTKFLNTLPRESSKFVIDVKLVRDLHTTNVDQLHAYLGQHEYHANEVWLMHERTSNPLSLVVHHQMNNSTYQQHQQSYHQHQFQPQASTYQSSQYATSYHPPQYASQAPSSTPLSLTYHSNDFQSSVNHNVYF
nr:hypothetical protein [Tanacetum cinerariifolium]